MSWGYYMPRGYYMLCRCVCNFGYVRKLYARSSPRLQLQLLVTGSLYLVGDVRCMLGKLPK